MYEQVSTTKENRKKISLQSIIHDTYQHTYSGQYGDKRRLSAGRWVAKIPDVGIHIAPVPPSFSGMNFLVRKRIIRYTTI